MAEDLYREPNRKAQLTTLVVAATFAIVVLSLEPLAQRLLPAPDASLEEIEAGATLLKILADSIILIAIPFGVLWVGYYVHLGYSTLKHGIYPPPGTIVLARTRVRSGRQASVTGYVLVVFAALIMAGLVLAGYGLWLTYSAL